MAPLLKIFLLSFEYCFFSHIYCNLVTTIILKRKYNSGGGGTMKQVTCCQGRRKGDVQRVQCTQAPSLEGPQWRIIGAPQRILHPGPKNVYAGPACCKQMILWRHNFVVQKDFQNSLNNNIIFLRISQYADVNFFLVILEWKFNKCLRLLTLFFNRCLFSFI